MDLHAASLRWLARSRTAKLRRVEIVLLVVHVTGYLGGVLWVLSPVHALVFVAVHQAVFDPTTGPTWRSTAVRRAATSAWNERGRSPGFLATLR